MLLGATTFFEILCNEQISLGDRQPILQKTLLGWVVAGTLSVPPMKQVTSLHCQEHELTGQLEKFWKLEEPPTMQIFSQEEEECLSHFSNATTRDITGKFIVNMPLKDTTKQLGNTLELAIKRLHSIERKFDLNTDIKASYQKFITAYKELGHMTKLNVIPKDSYYLPHHPVLKADSITTKLRVVFDGSAQPSNGLSLNQIQKVGPTIQRDLFSILLNFRTHAIAVTADVEKMYRQVLIDTSQRHHQTIVWRDNKEDPIEHYQLNTVTYGQAAAPFLAIRSLVQLAYENITTYPDASKIIQNDFYVDDLLSGAATEEEAFRLFREVTDILGQGSLKLRKWSSNSPEILKKISKTNEAQESIIYVCENTSMKTLGVHWNPQEDIFKYTVNINNQRPVTKRNTLSIIAQIYDPLGLISPIIVIAKCFMQKLWNQKLEWDEPLPKELCIEWSNFIFTADQVNNIKIPRFALPRENNNIELHCFCDASEKAYAASIYARVSHENESASIHLLCAKTKVAPLKSLSIPRLELCGALLLSRLASKVKQAIKVEINQTIFWTDSTVVLHWISTSPHLLKTFVANRVTEIQNLTIQDSWKHVPTKDNPADIASRGAYADSLSSSKMWWQGPDWLAVDEDGWPNQSLLCSEIPELKQIKVCYITVKGTLNIFDKFSTASKLVRVVCYMIRFKRNYLMQKATRIIGPLTMSEINYSNSRLVKLAQTESFSEELQQLSKGKHVHKSSKLFKLNPFIDSEGVLRISGRLQNSNFNENKKHPMVLDSKHALTRLIFQEEHVQLTHAGPQLLLSHIRDTYWPIRGRNLAKEIVRSCVKCFKTDPKPLQALMGNLPANRLESTYPFYITGVDYAGPFLLRENKVRKANTTKCYICIFVCLVTRAIHLELVSDLSTDAFLMTLRRFVARRGKPAHMYSDNGTNFVGANNRLRELGDFIRSYESQIIKLATNEIIDWHFIPANSPNFGGLWEAGVKSTKYHLRRVIGNEIINFEHFITVLTQIEAVLNSRPISPLTDDINDLSTLTPGHFLVGRPLLSIPDPNVTLIPNNRLTKYERIQQLCQNFWSRWSKEYISELQQRQKWNITKQNLKIGTMVVIKDDKLPPLSWALARVIEVHPGNDGVVRVATLRTQRGDIRRAVTKICPLPLDQVVNSEQ